MKRKTQAKGTKEGTRRRKQNKNNKTQETNKQEEDEEEGKGQHEEGITKKDEDKTNK